MNINTPHKTHKYTAKTAHRQLQLKYQPNLQRMNKVSLTDFHLFPLKSLAIRFLGFW